MLRFGLAALVFLSVGCGADEVETPDAPAATAPDAPAAATPDAPPPAATVFCADPPPAAGTTDLAALPGVASVRMDDSSGGYVLYRFTFRQLVDHAQPGGATFTQRASVLHKDPSRPTVLGTLGYDLVTPARHEEPTDLLGANQALLEHRFFGQSVPAPLDWSKLDIWQAAADDHCLVAALRVLYPGPWVATGQSKGGMTALFYRRFFPDDMAGTVSYVTPLSLGAPDPRYVDAVENGPHPECREQLRALQKTTVARRETVEAHMMSLSPATTFDKLGLDEAFEHLALELPFGFWQFGDFAQCGSIPADSPHDDTLLAFLDAYGDFASYGDGEIARFGAYYVQAATQLGFPMISETNLAGMLNHPGTDLASTYVPTGAPTTFDPAAMPDIDSWIRNHGERLLFVYGETDAWSGGRVELGAATDSLLLVVPDGNHNSLISDLGTADRMAAVESLRRWTSP